MFLKNIPKQLEAKGLPYFWQLYIMFSVSLSFLSYFRHEDYWLNILICLLAFNGILASFRSHKQKSFPRKILAYGALIVVFARLLISFDFPVDHTIRLLLEELGVSLITIFGFFHLLMFEKKFNIKGIVIDFSLLIVACLLFFLLISPDILKTLLYELNFYQQLLVLNIFIGSILLSMSIFHYFLTKSIGLTDSIRILLTILLIVHYGLEASLTFEIPIDKTTIAGLSLSSYHFAGAMAIVFIFIEKISLDYPSIAQSRLGSQFMWIASIIAIISIPLGLVIRSLLDIPAIDPLLVGIAGSLLSTIVIWRFIILIRNANQQKERIQALIQTNSITGLPNYHGYLEKITLSRMSNLLILTINIDDFKSINDLYGRDSADIVLKSLAKRIKKLPKVILIAHTHSDIFLVVFQVKKSEILCLVDNIQATLGVWDNIKGKQLTVPLSYGASYCNGIAKAEEMAKQAEQALKIAREKHQSFYLYVSENESSQLPRHELRDILQESVDNDYLPVHFQPIYNLKDGSLIALELLIRVKSNEHGLLLPGQFLDQAKAYGLLTPLTQVCVRMIARNYKILPDVVININLPPYMLKNRELLNNFIALFKEENLPTNKFCIEITEDENILTTDLLPAVQLLKECGFTIAMDDFGTGYSSLDRLSMLSVDTVKIDRSILLAASSGNTAILEWAISLAKRLCISAVVEGVETKEQLSLVKQLGADSVQGFLYSKPIPIPQIKNIALNSSEISIV